MCHLGKRGGVTQSFFKYNKSENFVILYTVNCKSVTNTDQTSEMHVYWHVFTKKLNDCSITYEKNNVHLQKTLKKYKDHNFLLRQIDGQLSKIHFNFNMEMLPTTASDHLKIIVKHFKMVSNMADPPI